MKLSDLRGRRVVLLFYPMDFSPVCTAEHCGFGPMLGERFPAEGNTLVFGVNGDSPFTHAAFKKQFNIPYRLLSDPTRRMLRAYGMFAGEEPFNCAKRGTVVIDEAGNVAKVQEVGILHARSMEEITALTGV